MNFTEIKNRQLVKLSLIVVALTILVGVFVFPVLRKINMIKKEINEEQEILNLRLKLGANAKQIMKDLEEAEINLPKLNSIYIKEGSELELINFIETIAQKNNLEVKINPNFNIPKTGSESVKIPLDISATGNFKDLFNFLKALDSAPFYLITDRLNLQKNQSGVILNLNGYVYLIK
jgi:Tfp pilus assembly protein PilO